MVTRGIGLICAMLVANCTAEAPTPVSGDQGMIIPDTEIPRVIERARAGDLNAANSLAVHYSTAGNPAESENWLLFAGSRGDCNALGVLYDENLLSDMPNEERTHLLVQLAAEFGCPALASD